MLCSVYLSKALEDALEDALEALPIQPGVARVTAGAWIVAAVHTALGAPGTVGGAVKTALAGGPLTATELHTALAHVAPAPVVDRAIEALATDTRRSPAQVKVSALGARYTLVR